MSKSEFASWASASPEWISPSPGSDPDGTVIASQVRIARNLLGVPFPHHASASAQKKIFENALGAVGACARFEKSATFQLSTLSDVERTFFKERQLLSYAHAREGGDAAVVVASGETLSVTVNEEDHVRAACFKPGLGLSPAWEQITQLDDDMAAHVAFAYNAQLGYITASPTNMGTGLRASCLLHLPALVLTGKIQHVIGDLAQSGLSARGFYGDGTTALGDLFQISNALTLGVSEAHIVKMVEQAVKEVALAEKKEEQNLLEREWRLSTEDHVFRALGTLQQARLLDYIEGMKCLSLVRLGIKLQWALAVSLEKLTQLYFLIQPAHLLLKQNSQKAASQPEALLRAQFVRAFLAK
jgi:protein arginine kinase